LIKLRVSLHFFIFFVQLVYNMFLLLLLDAGRCLSIVVCAWNTWKGF